MTDLKSLSTDRLFKAVLNLKSIDDCYDFFNDLCTIKELHDMSQRMDTAILLDTGKNYQEVSKETGASTATISRVNKCLRYGTGGYRKAIDNLTTGENK